MYVVTCCLPAFIIHPFWSSLSKKKWYGECTNFALTPQDLFSISVLVGCCDSNFRFQVCLLNTVQSVDISENVKKSYDT